MVNINLPAPDPSFAIPPVPVNKFETVIPPSLAVPKVKLALSVMPPEKVKVLAAVVLSVLILDAVGTVIAPDKVAAAELPNNLMAPFAPL